MTGGMMLLVYIGGSIAAERAGWGIFNICFWPIRVSSIVIARIITWGEPK